MNKLYYIIICIFFVACTQLEDFSSTEHNANTRGIVNTENSSITNPTLLTDWENLKTVVLNTSTPDNKKTATLPWENGAISLMPESNRKDIKKEDGWTMLLHTFKNYGEDEKSCYMIFYNRFRGILKVFYYLDENPTPNNNFLWKIQTDNNQKCSLFNIDPIFSQPIDSLPKNNSMILSNLGDTPTNGVSHGWNGFEIKVPEYSTEYRNINFTIQGYNKAISSFSFTGNSTYTSKGSIIRTTPDNNGSSNKGTADVSSEGSKEVINNIYNSNNGFSAGNIVKNAIAQIPQTGYIEAFSKGLKYVGNISAYSNNTVQTRATATDEVNMEMKAQMSAEGNISTILTSAIASISGVNLYNNNEDLGVWSVKTPVIVCERYTQVLGNIVPSTNGSAWSSITNPYSQYPGKSVEAYVNINPALEKYIISKKIDCEFVVCDSLHGKAYQKYGTRPQTQLLYKSKDIMLSESNSYITYKFSRSFPYKAGKRPFYDWGVIDDDGDLVLITVKLVFKYNDKETTVISSKIYKPTYRQGDVEWILHRGDPFIVNDPGRFP
nr:hypothetical protein [uncultured Bacteroides sp.]